MSLQNLFVQDSGKSYQDIYCDKLVANELEVAGGSQTASVDFSGIWAAAQSRTVTYEQIGNVVTLRIPAVENTATTAAEITSTALPAALHPSTEQRFAVSIVDNNLPAIGIIEIDSAGVLKIYNGPWGSNFTGTNQSGLSDSCITYSLV